MFRGCYESSPWAKKKPTVVGSQYRNIFACQFTILPDGVEQHQLGRRGVELKDCVVIVVSVLEEILGLVKPLPRFFGCVFSNPCWGLLLQHRRTAFGSVDVGQHLIGRRRKGVYRYWVGLCEVQSNGCFELSPSGVELADHELSQGFSGPHKTLTTVAKLTSDPKRGRSRLTGRRRVRLFSQFDELRVGQGADLSESLDDLMAFPVNFVDRMSKIAVG